MPRGCWHCRRHSPSLTSLLEAACEVLCVIWGSLCFLISLIFFCLIHLLKPGSSPPLVYCNARSTGVGPVCSVGPALLLSSVCFLRHVQPLEQLRLARCWQSACWAQPCSAWAEPGEAGSRTGRLPGPALCLLSSREQFHIPGRLGCGSRSSPSLPWAPARRSGGVPAYLRTAQWNCSGRGVGGQHD